MSVLLTFFRFFYVSCTFNDIVNPQQSCYKTRQNIDYK